MSEPNDSGGAGASAGLLVPAALACAFVVFVHAVWAVAGDVIVAERSLADGDSFLRLVRIERLLETGAWFDSSLPRVQWPAGGTIHWTRPFDVLLIALAAPLKPFLGWKAALYWSGALVSPLLHLAAAAVMAWAARPLVGAAGAAIAGALTALQAGVLGYATTGHADHHMLLGLIALAVFGFTVRAVIDEEPAAGAAATGAGLALAAGLWVGAEAQVAAALAVAVLAGRWVGDGAAALARNRRLALALAGGLAAVLLIERGPGGFLDVAYDRVSLVHLSAALAVLALWVAVSVSAARAPVLGRRRDRLVVAAAGGAAALGGLGALYPKLLVNPLMDVDPAVAEIFGRILEGSAVAGPGQLVLYVGAAALALAWALWRTKGAPAGGRRWGWLLLALSVAVYGAFAATWVRWALYAGLFAAIALADLIVWIDAEADRRFRLPGRIPIKVLAVVLVAVGPLAVGAALVFAAAAEPRADSPRHCPVASVAGFLDTPPWRAPPRAILTSPDFGAELLYRTPHRVTATLHHTHARGILDSVRILGGADAAAVRDLVRARQVDLILICRLGGHGGYLRRRDGPETLYRRLLAGDAPGWLRPVALPPDLTRAFVLFETDRGR